MTGSTVSAGAAVLRAYAAIMVAAAELRSCGLDACAADLIDRAERLRNAVDRGVVERAATNHRSRLVFGESVREEGA